LRVRKCQDELRRFLEHRFVILIKVRPVVLGEPECKHRPRLGAKKDQRPVGYLMITHHGAALNFDRSILAAVEENTRLFVSADAGDPHRPHPDVCWRR
jgi:hypothetical protein